VPFYVLWIICIGKILLAKPSATVTYDSHCYTWLGHLAWCNLNRNDPVSNVPPKVAKASTSMSLSIVIIAIAILLTFAIVNTALIWFYGTLVPTFILKY
jgi:hypothetical protein